MVRKLLKVLIIDDNTPDLKSLVHLGNAFPKIILVFLIINRLEAVLLSLVRG